MTAQYLLPCSCGQQVVVEPRQAGETITCSCGAVLQIPTLLDMRSLDPAEPSPATSSAKTWSIRDQLRLLGIVFLLAAIGGGVWLYLKKPVSKFDAVSPEQIREGYKKFTPSTTWDGWNYMQRGLDRRIDQDYAAAMAQFQIWQGVVAVITLAGIAMLAAGTIGRKKNGPPTKG